MQLIKSTNIQFIAHRKRAYIFSLSLLALGIVATIIRGGLNYGIDFRGGTSIVLQFKEPVTVSELRNALKSSEIGSAEIKRFGSRNEVLIYVKQQKEIGVQTIAVKVDSLIQNTLPELKYERIKFDTVGPKIGKELRTSAIFAVLIALLLILVYIGWRFELVFSIGAIIALFHDVLITLGIFTLAGFELSLKEIAAFLTIVGYSLNDTIVVYDRIRENLKVLRSEELDIIINKSINQTLSRTLITSGTTLIVVLVLFLFGGSVIKGFAFAMVVGIFIGTYSSIYVASPLVIEWQSRHGGKGKLRMMKRRK
jgi:preprotein translocase subunit SecF